ncbi:MAG TPA: hypothetical protein VJV05_17585 [Pyrinomonadaceae bacterium]|nr:hypothetical protein [Pyrinomonadaceae bacterium]
MTNGRGLRPSWIHTILLGGLTVGVLDCIAAMTNAYLRSGVTPDRVWQYVASSVLGQESFNQGATSIAVGLLFHFCVALGVAIGFYILARIVPVIIRYPFIVGPLYGMLVYFAMSYGIVPLTQARQGAFNWYGLLSGLIIHMLFVGLPVALITKRFAR